MKFPQSMDKAQLDSAKDNALDVFFLHSPKSPKCMDFFAAVHNALTQTHPFVKTAGPSWEDIKEASDFSNLLDQIFTAKVVLCVFAEPSDQHDFNSNEMQDFDATTTFLQNGKSMAEANDCSGGSNKKSEQKDCDEDLTVIVNEELTVTVQGELTVDVQECLFQKSVEATWFESCKNMLSFIPVVLDGAKSPRYMHSLLTARFMNWPFNTSSLNTAKWRNLIKSILTRL